jgi:hypothetical protein
MRESELAGEVDKALIDLEKLIGFMIFEQRSSNRLIEGYALIWLRRKAIPILK